MNYSSIAKANIKKEYGVSWPESVIEDALFLYSLNDKIYRGRKRRDVFERCLIIADARRLSVDDVASINDILNLQLDTDDVASINDIFKL